MRRTALDKAVGLMLGPLLAVLLLFTILEIFYNFTSIWIDILDAIVVIVFAIDLYYRWHEFPHLGTYLKKYWLDIIATIPFGLIFWGIEGLALTQGLKILRPLATFLRELRLVRGARALRLFRAAARSPRFLRVRKDIKHKADLDKVAPHEKKFKKGLSFPVILLITINSIMGTGIWFLTSAGAATAGPASLVSWLVLSIISIYIAMCFAELVSMFPKAGGIYEFAKQAYGRFWSFVIGWTTAVAGAVTIAMLLLGALQYLIPLEYASYYVPLGIGLLLIFSVIAYRGMQTSKVALITFALITLGAVAAIIVPGVFSFNPQLLDPFFVFPSMTIVLAIFFIAETFFGWESAIFLASETQNPTKDMPRALIIGTVIIAILAFLLAFTAMGNISWDVYSQAAAPIKDLGSQYYGDVGGTIFAILIFVSVIGATAGWIVTSPRLLMAIAEDKLFFVHFSKIHPKRKSPYVSIIFQFVMVSALIVLGAGSYETLLHMLIPLIIIMYSSVMFAVAYLRFKRPDVARPYKAPLGKLGPFVSIAFMLFLLVMFIAKTHAAFDIIRISAGLILIGIPSYLFIEFFYDPRYVSLRRQAGSWIRAHLNIMPHFGAFARMMRFVGGVKNKKVLDISSPGAKLTKRVVSKAKSVTYLTMAKHDLRFVPKSATGKVVKLGSIPKNTNVDVVFSYNDVGFVPNMSSYVKRVANALSKKGTFCFYLSQNIVSVAPNTVELSVEEDIVALFKRNGLSVKITHRKHLFREEIYLYGVKK